MTLTNVLFIHNFHTPFSSPSHQVTEIVPLVFVLIFPSSSSSYWKRATSVQGQAANAADRWDARSGTYVAQALEVMTLDGTLVKEMTAFMMPEVFPLFGLPGEPRRTLIAGSP